MKISEAAEYLRMSRVGVRRASVEGRIKHTVTASGHRRYTKEALDEFLGMKSKAPPAGRVEALYVRVSPFVGPSDITSMEEQERILRSTSSGMVYKVYSDVSSGLNERRSGLQKMLQDASMGKFSVVRVVWKDRLSRFGVVYLRRLLDSYGVKLDILHDHPSSTVSPHLAEERAADLKALDDRGTHGDTARQ